MLVVVEERGREGGGPGGEDSAAYYSAADTDLEQRDEASRTGGEEAMEELEQEQERVSVGLGRVELHGEGQEVAGR